MRNVQVRTQHAISKYLLRVNDIFVPPFCFSITINKNSIHGDTNMMSPGGVRLGTPALTSRSFKEQDFVRVAEFLHQAVQIALKVQVSFQMVLLKILVQDI